ncbi:hypothetical protein [Streptomyces sp. NBC_01445]|uniref:hypothetical protein n=1 Tax=Streptomyces sp. NBC_01445 TaxID=2903869 RepID=UPI002DD92314|nr:hypothetical protein [Streptomyces sp. NBC_01445]WSE04690.1 hypothetical protein OG574_15785 [Streptomyces sp. NBC_01445]
MPFFTVVTSGCHDGQFSTSVCTFQIVRSSAWITMSSRVITAAVSSICVSAAVNLKVAEPVNGTGLKPHTPPEAEAETATERDALAHTPGSHVPLYDSGQ